MGYLKWLMAEEDSHEPRPLAWMEIGRALLLST